MVRERGVLSLWRGWPAVVFRTGGFAASLVLYDEAKRALRAATATRA